MRNESRPRDAECAFHGDVRISCKDAAEQWEPDEARVSRRSCCALPAKRMTRRWDLARQFQEKLGRSASELLTDDIRMAPAANELNKPSMSTSAVAEAVGYQSEAAFQRAFKSHMGLSPAQWRKTQEIYSADLFAMRRSPPETNR
jgi:AraC-like DNA-binding protein